ncbi:MAG: glycosyltransferase family 4 protein [Planctomycetota bacterium]|nr:glycosyltransferase family 4 protein [Planctomycetota bacterium]
MPAPTRPARRVLLLNQAFHPDVVATAQMGKDLADELSRRGHQVMAIASRSIYGRSGAVLPRREAIEVPGGLPIGVHRVGASLFGKAGYAARIADFALFYLLALIKALTLPRADVVICYTTPPFIALVGLICRVLRGSRAIYWVMDLYPDLPVACGVMKPAALPTRLFERLNRFLLRRSDVDVVLGRCMRDRVLAKGVPESKVRLIPVWADLAGVEPVAHEANPYRARWAPGGELVVMYSGNFGIGHDATTILGAMERLRAEAGLRFVFVGGGKRRAEVESFIREKGLTNAAWHDYQPREQLGASLSAGDIHLISLREGVEGIMVPSKLFGIMAVGRASIFVGNTSSEIARVLSESDAGVTVREGDADGLARAILALRDDAARRRAMGDNARRAISGRYDRETACRAWVELIESVGAQPDAAGARGGVTNAA